MWCCEIIMDIYIILFVLFSTCKKCAKKYVLLTFETTLVEYRVCRIWSGPWHGNSKAQLNEESQFKSNTKIMGLK